LIPIINPSALLLPSILTLHLLAGARTVVIMLIRTIKDIVNVIMYNATVS